MSRRTDAPSDFECPYRHKCPHLDGLSTTWAMEVYQEAFELRQQLYAVEARCQKRIDELEKALLDKDRIIAQLRLQHQKRFKANSKDSPPPVGEVRRRRRGAPVGHPAWRRREPDHIDQVIDVAAPAVCPHCQCDKLLSCTDVHKHVQEDIVLMPRTCVTQFVHQQSLCPRCRRAVHQTGPGELRHCDIGPVARAVATHHGNCAAWAGKNWNIPPPKHCASA